MIDVTAIYFFAYGILLKRYNNKELFVSCCLFNIFLMLIVMAIIRTEFNIAIGFGLFALLSLVTIRSATFTKTEMAYFFGVVALSVINGAGLADYVFVIMCNVIIVVSAWIISKCDIEHTANVWTASNTARMSVILDNIDQAAINSSDIMIAKLTTLFELPVVSYSITKVDYVRDTVGLQLFYDISKSPHPRPPVENSNERVRYVPQS